MQKENTIDAIMGGRGVGRVFTLLESRTYRLTFLHRFSVEDDKDTSAGEVIYDGELVESKDKEGEFCVPISTIKMFQLK